MKKSYSFGQAIGAAVPTEKEGLYVIAATDGLYVYENNSSRLVKTLSDFYKPYKYPQYMENVRGKTPCHGVSWPIFHSLLVEILFDPIDRLLFAKGSEVLSVIGSEIITYFEQVKLPLKIRKDFDKERFIEDLREFFNNCDGS